jgi:predicted DNA-binding transcriptional regulator AlpA
MSTNISQPPTLPLLTADDVAAMLQVSKRTVWRMRQTLQLPRPVKVGGAVRWRAADIESWIAQGCRPPESRDNGHGTDRR